MSGGRGPSTSVVEGGGGEKPLEVTQVTVEPPGPWAVRVKTVATALCHSDAYTLDGLDPEGTYISCVRLVWCPGGGGPGGGMCLAGTWECR